MPPSTIMTSGYLFILSILLKISYVDSRLVALQVQFKYFQNIRNSVTENGTLRCCNSNDKFGDVCKSPCQPWIDIKIIDQENILFKKTIMNLPRRSEFMMDNDFTQYNILLRNWTEKSVIEIKVYNSGNTGQIIIDNININISQPAASENKAQLNQQTLFNSINNSRLGITWKLYNRPDFYLDKVCNEDGRCDTNGYRVCKENYYGYDCSVFCLSSPSKNCVIKKQIYKSSTFVNLYVEINSLFTPKTCINGLNVHCFLEITDRNKTMIRIRNVIPTGSSGSFGAIFPNWTHPSDIILVVRTYKTVFGQLLLTNSSTLPDEDVRNAELHSGAIDNGFNMTVRYWLYYSEVFQGGCYESEDYYCSTNGSKVCKFGRYGSECDHMCPDQEWSDNGSCNTNVGWLCNKGWKGENCSDVQNCDLGVCKNNGTCLDTIDSYTCTCMSGWTGKNCTININMCEDKERCENGGTCISTFGSYYCVCPTEWKGTDCSEDVDECQQNVCRNGGTCLNYDGGYNCTCPKGFKGGECERDINECFTDICLNNGSCTNHPGYFTCVCSSGWVGNTCNVDINECQSDVCVHGNCSNTQGSYVCTCDTGWVGSDCQTDINECESNPCIDGSCINLNGSFLCEHDSTSISYQSGEFLQSFTALEISQTKPVAKSTSKALNTVSSLYPTKTDFPSTDYNYVTVSETDYNSVYIVPIIPETVQRYSTSPSSQISIRRSEINSEYLTSDINNIQPSTPVKLEPRSSSQYLQKTQTLPISTTNEKVTTTVSVDSTSSPSSNIYMNMHSKGPGNNPKSLLLSTKSFNGDLQTENVAVLSIGTTRKVNIIPEGNGVFTSSQRIGNFRNPTTRKSVVRHEQDVTTLESSTVKIDGGVKKESSSKGWLKDNLLLVLGVSIGVSVVLVVVVIFLVCKRRRNFSKQRQGPHSELLANKKMTLLLEPQDELDERHTTKSNPMYDIMHGKNSLKHQTSV